MFLRQWRSTYCEWAVSDARNPSRLSRAARCAVAWADGEGAELLGRQAGRRSGGRLSGLHGLVRRVRRCAEGDVQSEQGQEELHHDVLSGPFLVGPRVQVLDAARELPFGENCSNVSC